jgi:hypothetical protein
MTSLSSADKVNFIIALNTALAVIAAAFLRWTREAFNTWRIGGVPGADFPGHPAVT